MCRIFIGQASGKAVGVGMKQAEQKKVLTDFRAGAFNTLVATCIGEEGLDIPQACLLALPCLALPCPTLPYLTLPRLDLLSGCPDLPCSGIGHYLMYCPVLLQQLRMSSFLQST